MLFQRHMKPAALCVLISLGTLRSCVTMTDTGATDAKADCLIFEPIGWSKRDTPATIEGVKEHNAVWKATCVKS